MNERLGQQSEVMLIQLQMSNRYIYMDIYMSSYFN